jgi:predicted DCC family thiol-disulfide oxidoreductase YuxK
LPHDVLYDADCGICEGCRRIAERLDWFGRYRWRAGADPEVLKEHPRLDAATLDAALHLVTPDGTLTGFDAIRAMLLRMPLGVLPGLMMHLPGVPALGRRAYSWVAANRRTVLACRVGEPTVFHRWAAGAFILAVLAVAAAGPVLHLEDWPLTCAPMFATRVEDDAARYSFRFHAVDAAGKSTELSSEVCGVPELRLKRIFFARFYGSTDPSCPYGRVPGDTPAAYEDRMSDFFSRIDRAAPRGTREIRLTVVRETGGAPERHVAGTYSCETRRFRRTP